MGKSPEIIPDLTSVIERGFLMLSEREDGVREIELYYEAQITSENPRGLFQYYDSNKQVQLYSPDDPYGESAWFCFEILPSGTIIVEDKNYNPDIGHIEHAQLTPQATAELHHYVEYYQGFGVNLFTPKQAESLQFLD